MSDEEISQTADLTLRLADGVLIESEADALEGLLESDPKALRSYQSLLDLEACLRGGRESVDLVDPTMARLRSALEEEITRGSMERIRSGPPPRWKIQPPSSQEDRVGPRPARPIARLRFAAVAALMLAAATALFLIFERSRQGPELGAIVAISPGVVLLRGGATSDAVTGDRLAADDSVQVPPGGMARIRFGTDIFLDLGPATSVALAAPSREAGPHGEDRARLVVSQGTVTASVSGEHASGRVVYAAPHAEASTTNGEMVVSVQPESTVFEVRKGHARIFRAPDGAVVDLAPGSFVLASASGPLVARHIAAARLHHPDLVPPDHTLPPAIPAPGHDQGLHPELDPHEGQRKTPR